MGVHGVHFGFFDRFVFTNLAFRGSLMAQTEQDKVVKAVVRTLLAAEL
jgi:hypothetical protein